jgi:hypothetical protein
MRIRLVCGVTTSMSGKQRLTATDESHLPSMELASSAHGIPHVVQREHGEASIYPGYLVIDSADVERATAVVRELQVTPPTRLTSADRRFRVFAAAAIAAIVAAALVLGAVSLLPSAT